MCVSSQFCDKHHDLLFRIIKASKDAGIRSNIVIALGDVAVSFSTIIDENSNELYRGLSDKDIVVKKNTLMVLTHLILNGMIKVKGQLGEMAKCVEDPDKRIADLAKLFFTELATKDNAIYNNLPDGETYFELVPTLLMPTAVISHLSVGAHAVSEETFRSIMKYIFGFIEKVCQNLPSQSGMSLLRMTHRRNKRRISSRNSANASASPKNRGSGEILRIACRYYLSNQNGR